ncbi:aromatic ring-hydroxylating oxygenase subunit alpha [Bacillus sp. 1P02SD]|uniref:aromatic ring-hydroxylating oxygenase subunit alpha n=1 Tax=Bacillus sp. 1P02SD TaxID=3132264 RepID=UPI0039A12932
MTVKTTIEGGWPADAKFEPTFKSYEYFDNAYFQKELENIWFKTWLCAGHVSEIPNVGDYFTVDIAKENLIVMRAKDGSIQTYYNVCRHRGSRLCEEQTGNFKKGYVVCPYHSWVYDGQTGNLVGTPNIPARDCSFDKSEYPLVKAKTEVWDGLIWINLDENAPSLKVSFALPESWSLYEKWGMKNLKIGAQKTYQVDANWKLIMENASECYHCGPIHPGLSTCTPPGSPRQYIDENIPGSEVLKHVGGMKVRDDFQRANLDGKAYRPNFPGLDNEDARVLYYVHFYPHSYICLASDYVFIAAMFPISTDKSIVKGFWLFEPEVLEEENPAIQDAIDIWAITCEEDWKACEWAHAGNQSKIYKDGGVLTPIDWRVANFKKYVQEKVKEAPNPQLDLP